MALYTLDDYNSIIFTGVSYKLPENVMDIIKGLTTSLGVGESGGSAAGATSSGGNDTFQKDNRKKGGRQNNPTFSKNKGKYGVAEDWERADVFKITKIERKEGVDKMINDIRICLNKISNKNYETQRDAILKYIADIVVKDDSSTSENEDGADTGAGAEDEIDKIANSIFDTASTNKFYSELYATLYKYLIEQYPLFHKIIPNFVKKYMENMENIESFDPNLEYDKYCDNNKLNDKRKAMSAFIVNIMKNGIIGKDDVTDIILKLQNAVLGYIDVEGKTIIVDEITENLSILISMSVSELSAVPVWENIMTNTVHCSKLKAKEHVSISSRCVFKYMDILDAVRKSTVVVV